MRLKLAFIFLLLSQYSISQSTFIDSATQNEISKNIISQNFVSSYNKKEIPRSLIRCLSKIDNAKFKLADPNEEFNATDVEIKKLPDKRLIYLAQSSKYLIITYEQGGFAYRIITRVIEYNDKSSARVFTYRTTLHKDIQEFKCMLENDKLFKAEMNIVNCH